MILSEIIREIEFKCEALEIDAIKGFNGCDTRVKAFRVHKEDIMESLNFEDVMNYYGGVKVAEWVEANR